MVVVLHSLHWSVSLVLLVTFDPVVHRIEVREHRVPMEVLQAVAGRGVVLLTCEAPGRSDGLHMLKTKSGLGRIESPAEAYFSFPGRLGQKPGLFSFLMDGDELVFTEIPALRVESARSPLPEVGRKELRGFCTFAPDQSEPARCELSREIPPDWFEETPARIELLDFQPEQH